MGRVGVRGVLLGCVLAVVCLVWLRLACEIWECYFMVLWLRLRLCGLAVLVLRDDWLL